MSEQETRNKITSLRHRLAWTQRQQDALGVMRSWVSLDLHRLGAELHRPGDLIEFPFSLMDGSSMPHTGMVIESGQEVKVLTVLHGQISVWITLPEEAMPLPDIQRPEAARALWAAYWQEHEHAPSEVGHLMGLLSEYCGPSSTMLNLDMNFMEALGVLIGLGQDIFAYQVWYAFNDEDLTLAPKTLVVPAINQSDAIILTQLQLFDQALTPQVHARIRDGFYAVRIQKIMQPCKACHGTGLSMDEAHTSPTCPDCRGVGSTPGKYLPDQRRFDFLPPHP